MLPPISTRGDDMRSDKPYGLSVERAGKDLI